MLGLFAVLVGVVALVLRRSWSGAGGDRKGTVGRHETLEGEPEAPARAVPPQPAGAAQPSAPEDAGGCPPVWILEDSAGHEVALLALRAAQGRAPTLVTRLEWLPTRGPLREPGAGPVELRVVHYDRFAGFAVLSGPVPPSVCPIPAARAAELPAGASLRAGVRDGPLLAVRLVGREPERLVLEPAPPRGAVVTTPAGRAVALALEGGRAWPLEPVLVWLGRPATGRPLAQVQEEWRASDPGSVLEDVGALLERRPSPSELREALAKVEGVAPRAAGPDQVRRLARAERALRRRLVRALAAEDPVAAFAEARRALERIPDDPVLVADAAALALAAGDPEAALGWYAKLRGLAPEHARSVALTIAGGVAASADRRRAAGRNAETLALLEQALGVFPEDVGLLVRAAQALSALGRPHEAARHAARAARLDASYRSLAAAYERAARRASAPTSRLEIPFDPRTRVIRARAFAGRHPLQMVVDTGASHTTIPSSVARALGLVRGDEPRVRVDTAGGTLEAPMVTLDRLRIGPIRVHSLPVVVLDLPGDLAGKGLLGLDVLRRLHVRIDGEGHRLILQRPSRPGGRR